MNGNEDLHQACVSSLLGPSSKSISSTIFLAIQHKKKEEGSSPMRKNLEQDMEKSGNVVKSNEEWRGHV